MKPYPSWIGTTLALIGLAVTGAAQEETVDPLAEASPPEANLPAEPIINEDYRELQTNSPFTRALNLSDSLILTGIARIGDETIATVLNKDSKESYVVSGNANAQGWLLSSVEGDQSNLERVTAKIAVSGGEVISVRFDEKQLKPGEAKPAGGSMPSGGSRGDSRGDNSRGPSPETKAMMDRLSDDQRREVFERLGRMRQENPNMSREEMSDRFKQELERAARGK